MKNLEQIRNDNWLRAELKVEQDAAQDYFERTGRRFENQNPVDQRKILDNYKEDNQ
jgi:hypothetical protein